MAKRFIDTNYFNDPFILSLKPDNKLLYIYFFTICDHAGVFEINNSLGNFHLDCKDYENRVLKFAKDYPDKLVRLNEKSFILMCFCKRQYPGGVNSNVRQIQGALSILNNWNIEIADDKSFTLRVTNGYEGLRRVNKDYGNDNGIVSVIDNTTKLDSSISWRNNFEEYKNQLREVHRKLIKDTEWLEQQEKYYPNVDIKLSLEKACVNYWATEAGWKYKKKQKTKEIDWKATLTNAIGMNKVYKPR